MKQQQHDDDHCCRRNQVGERRNGKKGGKPHRNQTSFALSSPLLRKDVSSGCNNEPIGSHVTTTHSVDRRETNYNGCHTEVLIHYCETKKLCGETLLSRAVNNYITSRSSSSKQKRSMEDFNSLNFLRVLLIIQKTTREMKD